MCLFQHLLTTTPIIVALTPNYTTYLFFVLQAKHRYHRLVCCAKQLFRIIDGDNSIAACHQLFLTSAVTTNYVFRKKNDKGHAGTSSTLTLSSSVFLGMMGDADSSGPVLWPLTSLTTCRDILLVSLCTVRFPLRFVFTHCQAHFQWFSTELMAVFLHIYISFQRVAYSEPSVGLLFALYCQHQCISIG